MTRALSKRLLRNAWASKAQVLAVAVAVLLGLGAYVSMRIASQSVETALQGYYEASRFADLFAELRGMPLSAVGQVEAVEGVAAVEGRVKRDVFAELGRARRPVVRVVSFETPQRLNRLYVHSGRLPGPGDSRCLALSSKFARANGLGTGDSLELVVAGERVVFRVSAIADSPEYVYTVRDSRNALPDDENFGIAFMHASQARSLLGLGGQANSLAILLEDGAEAREVEDALEEKFGRYGLEVVVKREDQLSNAMVQAELEQLRQFSTAIPLVFLGISAVTVFLMVSRLVDSDRIAIGILKALGYSSGQVIFHYAQYGIAIGLLGSAPGVLLGNYLGAAWCRLYARYFSIPLLAAKLGPLRALAGVAGSCLLCGLAALAASLKVIRVTPAEAMRPAVPLAAGRSVLERCKPLWERLGPRSKMIVRGIARNRRRFAVATTGVAMTYAVIFLPVSMMSAFDFIIREQFSEVEAYDYAVSFNGPLPREATRVLRYAAGGGVAEPVFDIPATLENGWREEAVLIRALDPDTKLYRFKGRDGRPVKVPRDGILLSEYLASRLGAAEGSPVRLTLHCPEERMATFKVAAVIGQYLGSGCYMSLDRLEGITLRKGLMTGAVLDVPRPEEARAALEELPVTQSIHSNRDLMETYEDMMGMTLQSISILVFLGWVLGFAILFNISVINVSERLREFSTLRVLGRSPGEVFSLIAAENLVAFVAGAVLGVPLGLRLYLAVAEVTMSEAASMPKFVRPESHAWSFLILALFFGAVTWAVWLRVRKIDFMEALRVRLT